MPTTVLLSAVEAHPGHQALADGGHATFCVLCGEPAELGADGAWTCGGDCQADRATGAMVDWYTHDWLPAQTNGHKPAPVAVKWPRLPSHDASTGELRRYLTTAAGLPAHHQVDRCHRWGPEAADAMTVFVRRPGQAHDLAVRFERQDDAGKPGTLRAAFARWTHGLTRMRHPTVAQALDFLTILCALATVTEEATAADETRAWLEEFERNTRPILGHSIADPERRYDALEVLRAIEFGRPEAHAFIRRELVPDRWPALLVDDHTGERWVRAGELATYLRHVYGVKGGISQSTLDSRLAEIGVARLYMEVRRPTGHPKLVLYRLQPGDA